MALLDTESKDKDKTIPDPMAAMIFFFMATSIYCLISIFNTDTTQRFIFKVCYILFIIVGQYFINLNLSESMCGVRQWKSTLYITIIPWTLIFVVLHLFLTLFPGWISPFSNTFGYLVVRLMGLPDLMKEILVVNTNEANASRALESVRSDSSLLINELHTESADQQKTSDGKPTGIFTRPIFDAAIQKLSEGGIFIKSIAKDQKDLLYVFVQMKDTVSEYVWNLLTGFLVTSISYNFIINTSCAKSPLEMKKRYDAYEASEAKKASDKKVADENSVVYQQSS